jgi:hypothetical protein
VGIGVTLVIFAMKHVLIDGTVARVTTLLMLGLVFSVVRHHWGTGASAVAHLVVNLYATVEVIMST